MIFTAAQIDAMLAAPMGQAAVIDDGSLAGLALQCKFTDPQRLVSEFTQQVEMTEPQAKVGTHEVEDIIDAYGSLRERLFTTGGKDYTIKTAEARSGGFTILMLEDA